MTTPGSPDVTPEDWGERYRSERPLYVQFADRLYELLERLLHETPIEVASLERRAKTVDSFVGKLYRKGQKYRDPLNEVTDLAGVRIITYYHEDLEAVGALVVAEFDVDEANSIAPAQSMEPDRFGYVAPSYVVTLDAARLGLGEWARFAGCKAEIQIRTIAQHAWAAVDHKLRYKRGDEAPPELQRDLSRLSALFELADKEFSDIRKRMAALAASYSESVQKGRLQLNLNRDSLTAFLGGSPWPALLSQRAVEAGWRVNQPIAPEDIDLHLARLLRAAAAVGFEEVEQLHDFLSTQLGRPWAGDALRQIAQHSAAHGYIPFAVPEDVLALLLAYWGRDSLETEFAETGLNTSIQLGLNEAIESAPEEF
jgi:ppGpp synthetase/RelA/SpoT-type nucleotidyltranferase